MTIPYQSLLDDIKIKVVVPYLNLKDCISYISSYKNKIPKDIIKNKLINVINSSDINQRAIFYKKNFEKMSIVFHYLENATLPFEQQLKIVNDTQSPLSSINMNNRKTFDLYMFGKVGNQIDANNKNITSNNIRTCHVNIYNCNTKSIDQIRIYNNAYYDYFPDAADNDVSSKIEMSAPQSFLSKFNLPKVRLRFGETFPSLSSENILVSFKIN